MSAQKKCLKCGKVNLPDDNFCKRCGIELKEYSPLDFVIKESLKGSLYGSIICIAVFIGFMILDEQKILLGMLALLTFVLGFIQATRQVYFKKL